MTECPSFTPDFFIIGAPKCGTTALYEYLKTHPTIFMPDVKEPTYFAKEFRERRSFIGSAKAYAKLYQNAGTKLTGDASPFYLSSENAMTDILKCNPKAKFIVMLRNPVSMFASYHAQALRVLLEDEKDPETAWNLQAQRLQSGAPAQLRYRHVCSLGSQMKIFMDKVPEDQRHVIIFDDFKADTRSAYKNVLAFLSQPDDGRSDFKIFNPRSTLRSPQLQKIMRSIYYALKPLKPIVNALGLRPFSKASRLNQKPARTSQALSDDFKAKLMQEFEPEISLLEEVLSKDLSQWRQ